MKKKYTIIPIAFAIMWGILLGACTSDNGNASISNEQPLLLRATLESPMTRSTIAPDKSRWWFDGTDEVGFYSSEQGANIKMEFGLEEGGGVVFKADDKVVDYNNLGICYAYCPYYGDMDNGMPVRKSDGTCEDLLITDKVKFTGGVGLTSTFYHAFAMLMIDGGEGFTNLLSQAGSLKVYLSRPIEKVHLDYYTGSADGHPSVEVTFTGVDEEHKVFQGQAGQKYIYTWNETTKQYDATFEKDVVCVIVPASFDDPVVVEAIEVCDELGNLQRVPLGMYVEPVNRYPLTLKMDGLKPSIFPHTVIKWGEDIVIGESNAAGINNIPDFERWLEVYNDYIKYNKKPEDAGLTDFGTWKAEDQKWHFDLNVDLDFAKKEGQGTFVWEQVGTILTEFRDVFDGHGHSFVNLTLKNPQNTMAGFIGRLGDGGVVQNLNLENFAVEQSLYAGAIAAEMQGGTVSGCTLTGLQLKSTGVVGGLVGKMQGGEIQNCTVSGYMIGAGTSTAHKGAVGEYAGGTLSKVGTANLFFAGN